MIRWKYVLPRLTLVLVLWLAVRFGLDPLVRWAIVASGESAVGAKIELASVRSLLLDGELELYDLCVANPRKPMRNLLESDQAKLKIDLSALFLKRLVVTNGTIRGLQFDTPREISGRLVIQADDLSLENSALSDRLAPWLESGKKLGTNWIDGIDTRFEQDLTNQLETPRVVKQLEDRWREQADELQARIEAIGIQSRQMKDDLHQARINPLRNLARIGKLQESFVAVQQELQKVTRQLQQLPEQAKEDRRAVLAARQHDEQLLRNAVQLDQVDGSKFSERLLGPMVSDRLKTLVGWARMAREMVPDNKLPSEPDSTHGRGVTVHFVRPRPLPEFLIKRLELSGTARLGGQPVELVGTLTNATNGPSRLATPTQIHLQSRGAFGFTVDIALDRRQKIVRDEIHIDCPRLLIPAQTLGTGALAMRLSPGMAKMQADVTLEGDRIDGMIRFVRSSIRLQQSGTKGGDTSSTELKLAKLLEQTVRGIDHVDANIRLAGRLDQVEWHLQSNLGPQLAHGFNQAAKQLVQKQASALLASTQQKADAQLAKLAQQRDQVQRRLLGELRVAMRETRVGL